jgi:hypothetical protein
MMWYEAIIVYKMLAKLKLQSQGRFLGTASRVTVQTGTKERHDGIQLTALILKYEAGWDRVAMTNA